MRLWDWTVEAYGHPGVPDACLELQDRHGQNTSFLLWAVWAEACEPPVLRAAAEAARAWETAAVAPLRAARRNMKGPKAPVDDAAREALREEVRALELAAERLLMETLETRTSPRRTGVSTLEALRGAALAWGGPAPDEALRTLADALDLGLLSHGGARHDRASEQRLRALMDKQDAEWEHDLRARLASVSQDHADLDAAIQALALSPLPDMLVIGRLKRKKLLLKDEITRIQDQLTPDIIA
jgi:uncharacterized protein (TIGR02444 family)